MAVRHKILQWQGGTVAFVGRADAFRWSSDASHWSGLCRSFFIQMLHGSRSGATLFANEQKCAGICSALHVPMQCAAMPDGARCTCQRSALRFPAEKTAVRGAAWQVGLHASLSTCREFLPPGRTVQSAFLLFPLGTQAGLSFPSSAKAEARHMRWHGLASMGISVGQRFCLYGVYVCVKAPSGRCRGRRPCCRVPASQSARAGKWVACGPSSSPVPRYPQRSLR